MKILKNLLLILTVILNCDIFALDENEINRKNSLTTGETLPDTNSLTKEIIIEPKKLDYFAYLSDYSYANYKWIAYPILKEQSDKLSDEWILGINPDCLAEEQNLKFMIVTDMQVKEISHEQANELIEKRYTPDELENIELEKGAFFYCQIPGYRDKNNDLVFFATVSIKSDGRKEKSIGFKFTE
ncbi:MAG: hypothetical protein ABIA74_01950 [bacterium]